VERLRVPPTHAVTPLGFPCSVRKCYPIFYPNFFFFYLFFFFFFPGVKVGSRGQHRHGFFFACAYRGTEGGSVRLLYPIKSTRWQLIFWPSGKIRASSLPAQTSIHSGPDKRSANFANFSFLSLSLLHGLVSPVPCRLWLLTGGCNALFPMFVPPPSFFSPSFPSLIFPLFPFFFPSLFPFLLFFRIPLLRANFFFCSWSRPSVAAVLVVGSEAGPNYKLFAGLPLNFLFWPSAKAISRKLVFSVWSFRQISPFGIVCPAKCFVRAPQAEHSRRGRTVAFRFFCARKIEAKPASLIFPPADEPG